MGVKDMTGGAAALAALVLSATVWLMDSGTTGLRDLDGLERASRQAVETHAVGQPLTWRDPATGTVATITPSLAYRDKAGDWCRPYSLALSASGGPEASTWLEACRDRAGQWSRRAYAQGSGDPALHRLLARMGETGEQLARN